MCNLLSGSILEEGKNECLLNEVTGLSKSWFPRQIKPSPQI